MQALRLGRLGKGFGAPFALAVGAWCLTASLAAAQEPYEQAYAKLVAEWGKADEGLDFAGASGKGDEAYKNAQVSLQLMKLEADEEKKKKPEADMKAAEIVALKFYKIALAKAPAESDENKNALNEIRDRVAYLTYGAESFDAAAIVGEYLCRKHPDNQFALHCAQIATASLLQNYNNAQGEEKGKALLKVAGLTAFIAEQWKGKPEGEEALGRLGIYAMAAGDVSQAKILMERMPKDSEHRYNLQLKLAQGMWYEYAQAMAKPEDQRPKDLDKLKEEAKQSLRQSTEWLRAKNKDKAEFAVVGAELSLVQIYNQLGEYENAKKVLDIPKTGLLTLALLNLEVLRQGTVNLREEIYKAALRTFLGLKDYARAEQTVNELSKVGGKGLDAAGVTKMFAGLAKQVLDEVTQMRQANAPKAEVAAKLDALVGLCEKVAERKDGHTFGTLSWPAETLYKQGEIAAATGEAPAGPIFAKAIIVYQTLLDRAKADKAFAPDPNAVNAVREKLAKCYREQGNQKEALNQFRALLKEHPKQITSQIEAARTYQAMGKASKDNDAAFEAFDNAIKGSDPAKAPDGKGPEANAIWGWAKISLMTQSSPQNKDLYHEARYNLALCKLLQANLYQASDPKKAKDLFQLAERDLHATYVLTKDMGGPDWEPKYDKLLRSIQEQQGKEPTGLPKKGEGGLAKLENKEAAAPVAKPQPSGGLAVANMPLVIGLLLGTAGLGYGGWVWMQAAAKARRQKALRK